jgi:hypothetical protein
MNTALEYSTRVILEGGRRCKKSTLNDLVHLTPLRIPLMNPPHVNMYCIVYFIRERVHEKERPSLLLPLYINIFKGFEECVREETKIKTNK